MTNLPTFRIDGPEGAPALVLGNSLGTSWGLWDPQIGALTGRFRVVRYEHPGHGGSPVGDPPPATVADLGQRVLALLDHLDLDTVSWCGLSLGGMVGMWLASHHPERVDRLVLACTAAVLGPASQWRERAAAVRGGGTAPLAETLLGRWFTPGFVARRPGVETSVRAMLASTDPAGYAACCEAIGAMDQTADLRRIEAPTLVISGGADPVTPPSTGLAVQQGIGGAGLVVLPGASHLANIEAAAPFTSAVVDHLAGTPLERGDRVRRAVLGDAHVERSQAAITPFNAAWVELITGNAWGDVWTRPGLSPRERSALTVALLAALGHHEELALHVAGARRNGLSDDEIAEVLLHTSVYAGVPAANAAFRVAAQVLGDLPSGRPAT